MQHAPDNELSPSIALMVASSNDTYQLSKHLTDQV